MYRIASLLLLALAISALLFGQATEGSILGSITDASGAIVTAAKVTVTNADTGVSRATTPDQTGEYVVSNLPPGRYSVTVESPGFRRSLQPPVELTVKARVRVDIALVVGDATQSVEVEAAAPMIRTDTAEVGAVVGREQLADAPVFDRNFMTLAGLIAGTTEGPASARQRDFSGSAVTVGGAAAEANNFIVDGVSNNMEFSGAMGVTPPLDAIQEFAIQTSQYSAEFGRSGGGVINVAIRSGTNQYHGFAYDYLRNDKLDAQSYDFTNTHPPKQALRRNLFGSGIGMPVVRNRLFFFGNYEGLRSAIATSSISSVPTAEEKQGNFSKSNFVVADPSQVNGTARTPFPNNTIPISRMDPNGIALLKLLPDPNYSDTALPHAYYANEQNRDRNDSFNAKGDLNLNSANIVTARVTQQLTDRHRSSWVPNDVLGGKATLNATNSGLTYTRIISPRIVNEARAGYNYLRFGNEMLYTKQVLDPADLPGLNAASFATGYPSVTIRNYTSAAVSRPIASVPTPFYLVEHSWQYMDNVTFQLDGHVLKIGAEYGRVHSNRFQGRNGGAVLTFNGNYTTPIVGQTLETARNGIPDLELGLANSALTQYAFDAVRIHSNRGSVFVQDDWRIRRNLTLNIGLRWDYYGPYREEQDRFANFDPVTGTRIVPESARSVVQNVLGIPNGALPAGWRYGSLDDVLPHRNLADFAPRFGFAWSPSRRLVLRGGAGLFYAATTANDFNNSGTEGNPFFFDLSLTGDNVNPIVLRQGFPANSVVSALAQPTFGAYYGPLDRHDPYTEKWSLTVQALPLAKTAVEVGYMGENGKAFPALVPGNQPTPGPGAVQARRPYPNIGSYWQYVPVNNSHYESLQVSVRQREMHGLSLQAAFTWSKALGYSNGTGTTLDDAYNLHYDWGILGYDIPRKLVLSAIYRLPRFTTAAAPVRAVIGGWTMSTLLNLRDGYPYTVGVSGPTLNNGAGTNRANLVGDPNLSPDQRTYDRWINTAAFTAPPNYVWGNQGKNMLRSPSFAQTDVSLQKRFPISDAVRFVVRADSQNVFNRVQLGTPISTYGANGFGAIRSLAGGPRNVQLALRLEF